MEKGTALEKFRKKWKGHVPGIQEIKAQYAVLVPLIERPEGVSLLYEVRAEHLGRQPGEVCFPGGKMEGTESPVECALRETWEELAIPPEAVEIVASLDWVTHQGGFVMYPVLGIVDPKVPIVPSPAEVKESFTVPVDWLLNHPPAVYTYDLVPQVGEEFPYERIGFPQGYRWRGGQVTVPVYDWPAHPIWGLTGRITKRLLEGLA